MLCTVALTGPTATLPPPPPPPPPPELLNNINVRAVSRLARDAMSSNMRALGLIIITLLLLTAGEGTAACKQYNIASLDLLFQEIFGC